MTELADLLEGLFRPFGPEPPTLYLLARDTYVAGARVTGIVAEGCQFSPAAGSAAVTRLRGERGQTIAWDRPGRLGEVGGHGDGTRALVLPVPQMAAALAAVAELGEQRGPDPWAHGWNEALRTVRGLIRRELAGHLPGVEDRASAQSAKEAKV
ncbi:hypothetical protein HUT16_27470 [Kitasatospora sp. NA04385]|uniref:hypothetical protein n=1 Tax=Kitasatospora sp. NA04385 TaxID=2742135 RepID=UPI001590669A|nr:hypothetical protein [Kitasatospora sp. NA04385]QKW22320.1 hypothetical protein HUT16_27470 [Kitasatospora sp. NA04385]